ncbi:MAG TPA: zinc-binding alcohol dehydrogenase [Conexibacter sp.]|nr:zinc-binding alcohol dehydrogenase [Conexibacter sp.]
MSESELQIPDEGPALVVTAFEQVALETRPVPVPGPGQVLVRTEYSGVSIGTELWAATGRHHAWGAPPFVPGYQAVGRVVALGEGTGEESAVAAAAAAREGERARRVVPELAVGDMVACFALGTHQRYLVAEASLAHRVEENDRLPAVSLFVQPAVGANALNHADVRTGDSVLVVGQGLIGQATAQLARQRGAYVIGSDLSPERIATARAHCVDRVLDVSAAPASEQLADDFPDGVDVVIESTGFAALVDDAMRCVRRGGTFVFEGFYPQGLAFDFDAPHHKEVRAVFPCFIGDRACREGVLRMLSAGTPDLQPLISDLHGWGRAADVYAQLFTERRDHFNAIVFDWKGS